ncbi:Protein FAM65B [Orchesella cincta]|uniref:Protein FAM65B n=1 Tax=Orchesella cincta TaxID=48709 RepID=A0A1D2MWV8_ORCCI|nr:Protein FAM65B [Orchesella cincta]
MTVQTAFGTKTAFLVELKHHSKTLHLQLKTLEYQLSRLENLQEQYELQQKLREGVRSMAYAYTLSNGKERDLALANVKAGFKECTEILGSLEAQVQEFLGGFHLTMKGIQGFARLCPGDTYEITIKHGSQKWKTRAKAGKDGSQNWDFPEAKITALLGDDLYIKAAEVKTLGKQILLGNKFCEIGELFAAHSQLMTVNLNPSGSLKLNVIVQWDPLAQFYEEMNSPSRKRRMISPSLRKHDYSTSTASTSSGSHHTKWAKLRELDPEIENLKESIHKLAGILNDEIQGTYPELEGCEVNVAALKRMTLQEFGGCKPDKYKSTSSLNIESALECFDFLDTCDVTYSPPPVQRLPHHRHSIGINAVEYDTKTTTDSGISSLNSRSPSPDICFVTGSENLDLALYTHVQICLKLVNNLGAFGPLKWRERDAINKLQQQGIILGNILNRINKMDEYIYELEGLPFIQKLWKDIAQNKTSLCTTADQAAYGLEKEIRKHHENSHSLARSLVMQIMDEQRFRRNSIVTVFQFILFLRPYETSFKRLVDDVAEEELTIQKLSTIEKLDETLKDLTTSGSVPPKTVFVHLVRLLVHDDFDIRESVGQYFEESSCSRRRSIIQNCVEMLESDAPVDRHSSVILLTMLNSTETLDAIAYLAQTDPDSHVREVAKQMLLRQKEGDRMHQQLTLSTNGFQGLLAA